MAESQEKQLIQSFCDAWNEVSPGLLGGPSALGLIALREVQDDSLDAALAVAATWSFGYVAPCTEALPGVAICLFKSEDNQQIEQLVKKHGTSLPKPSMKALLANAFETAATRFAGATQAALKFGEITHIDLSNQEARLKKIVGNKAWVGTFSLSAKGDLDTQALLLYAPNGSLEPVAPKEAPAATAAAAPPPTPAAQPSAAPAASRRTKKEEPPPRNIERLLEVELEIIVRFGTTSMPLRDVVRLGTGTMIELNRGVDEPVELLVNNRQLARGEVVVIDGYYGVRITEIGGATERASLLEK